MSNIKSLKTSKDPLGFIENGVATWTPRHANTVFQRCRYAGNRDENKGKAHIAALARQMRDGEWVSRQSIDFARQPDGTLTLVNGHHRMLAQVESGRDIQWNVVIHDVEDEDGVAALFYRFDTVVRLRTMNNILDGIGAADQLGLSKMTTVALSRAVVFIDNGMHPTVGHWNKTYTPAEKLSLMADWQVEARVYQDCANLAVKDAKRKMFGAQVMAVALVTIRANTDSAIEFWQGVAEDDGLRRGDPRKTLLDFLRDTHAAGGGLTFTAAACARAWSAWEANKQLTMIRVGRQPVKITGTNVVVTP